MARIQMHLKTFLLKMNLNIISETNQTLFQRCSSIVSQQPISYCGPAHWNGILFD